VNDAEDRLARLRLRFLDRCVEDLAALKPLVGRVPLDREAARWVVHRLAGAAGTFGFGELSRVAGEADDGLLAKDAPDPDLTPLIREMERTLTAAGL
jgi:HPt (histidine-containing phosphotransfer) domain-containing protein